MAISSSAREKAGESRQWVSQENPLEPVLSSASQVLELQTALSKTEAALERSRKQLDESRVEARNLRIENTQLKKESEVGRRVVNKLAEEKQTLGANLAKTAEHSRRLESKLSLSAKEVSVMFSSQLVAVQQKCAALEAETRQLKEGLRTSEDDAESLRQVWLPIIGY